MIAESNAHDLFGEGESSPSASLVERSLTVNGMTCGACVSYVERALRGVSGVAEAKVSLDRGEAKVRYDPAVTGFAAFREAVQAAGYDLKEDRALDQSPSSQALVQPLSVRSIAWPAIIGLIAAALLASLYIFIVGITQDFGHAINLVTGDWYFVVPIALGFGVQVGLFVYVRRVLKLRKSARTANAVTGVGTGTSTVSMIACCAHHLADVVPILGLSGAAVFLNDNRGPFMALGIAGNMVGIVVMARMVRRIRRQACHVQ